MIPQLPIEVRTTADTSHCVISFSLNPGLSLSTSSGLADTRGNSSVCSDLQAEPK